MKDYSQAVLVYWLPIRGSDGVIFLAKLALILVLSNQAFSLVPTPHTSQQGSL